MNSGTLSLWVDKKLKLGRCMLSTLTLSEKDSINTSEVKSSSKLRRVGLTKSSVKLSARTGSKSAEIVFDDVSSPSASVKVM